jgi:hypothetical protein
MFTVMATLIGLVIVMEIALWMIFERQVDGLHLHLASTTRKRIFTLPRIRMLALLHTLFLVLTITASLTFLW